MSCVSWWHLEGCTTLCMCTTSYGPKSLHVHAARRCLRTVIPFLDVSKVSADIVITPNVNAVIR